MSPTASASTPAPDAPPAPPLDPTRFADAYYLSACPICNGHLGAKGETLDRDYGPRNLRFCRDACRVAFESAPDAHLPRIDRLLIADQLPYYPLRTSIASGDPLRPDPIDFIWGNRLFRVNADTERERVLADPIRFIRQLDRAVVSAQQATYGMPTKCPVQGDILASDVVIDIVVANRMIRVCCARCVRVVKARPSQYLSIVEYANRAARERRDAEAPSEQE